MLWQCSCLVNSNVIQPANCKEHALKITKFHFLMSQPHSTCHLSSKTYPLTPDFCTGTNIYTCTTCTDYRGATTFSKLGVQFLGLGNIVQNKIRMVYPVSWTAVRYVTVITLFIKKVGVVRQILGVRTSPTPPQWLRPWLVKGFKQPLQINDLITFYMLPFIPLHSMCTHFWQLVHCIADTPTPLLHTPQSHLAASPDVTHKTRPVK